MVPNTSDLANDVREGILVFHMSLGCLPIAAGLLGSFCFMKRLLFVSTL